MNEPIGGRSDTWRSVVPMLLGFAVAALGALMIAGVGGGRAETASIGTAAGFMMIGLALVAAARGRDGVMHLLAMLVLAAAVATIWQHERVAPYAHEAAARVVGAPWPAASTAVAGALAAVALLVGGSSPAAGAMLGVGVLAIGVLGFTGRALELHSTFVGTMPALSAIGCVLAGLGLALRSGTPAARTDLAARYTPYAAGATCFLATVLFWQSLVTHQRAELQRIVEMTAVGSLAELGAFTTSVTRALSHIAEEWNAAGRLPAAQWRYQCRLVLERLGGPRTVEWIDDAFDVVYVVTPPRTTPGVAAVPSDPAPPVDDAARNALIRARAGGTPAATPTFAYAPDQAAFRLAVPLFRRGELDGFVSALFTVDEMLDDLLATRIHDYVITVFEGDRQIYGPRSVADVAPCAWCRPYTLDLPGDRSWEVRVQPSAELRDTIETSFPQMILAAGLLISVLLTAMLQLLARERRTARDLARANRALHDEVFSRRTAEDEIRTLATELEQRVRDRTRELATSNTALRNENALRQRTQATLESANQNLRHFASFVSHELRQPLATMALWSELLETNREVGLNEKGHGYLKQLRAAIERMTGFLEAQLRLARVTYTQPTLEEDVDVAGLIREVVGDGTLGLHAAGATVEIGDVPTVHADSAQLRQLFRNLLENAVKYRRPDTPLFVRIDGSITSRSGSRYCEIRVSDNGQGFAESDTEKIFDLFEQLPGRKSRGAGSGVGLAICRRIVEHHGGTIRAEGKPGAGATFVIDLPLERCEGRDPDQELEVIRA